MLKPTTLALSRSEDLAALIAEFTQKGGVIDHVNAAAAQGVRKPLRRQMQTLKEIV
jgi:hypothetical protein